MTPDDDVVVTAQKLLDEGQQDRALGLVRDVLERSPSHAVANNLAGYIALKRGDPRDAEARFRIASQTEPRNTVYRDNYTLARNMQQPWTNTEPLRAELATDPRRPDLWLKLAQAEAAGRRIDAAVDALYAGLSYYPEHPAMLHALGKYLYYAGRLHQAATHYTHCLRVAPHQVDVCIELSQIYLRLLDAARAETLAREAVRLAPQSGGASMQLGQVLYQRNRFRDALEHLEWARHLKADGARICNLLGMTHSALGNIEKALDLYRESIRNNKESHSAHTNLMLALLYSDQVTGKQIHEHARAYGKRMLPRPEASHANTRDPERRLRIGFVSGDFRRHVVGLFLLPLFEHRDVRSSIYCCYSLVDTPDFYTAMIKRRSDHWVDIRALDDAQLEARVRADGIDVLFDLSGHTSDNRLQVFAREPAPVQVTWLGFPGTTGAPGMRYRLTDDVLDPPGSEALSTERPIRLAQGYFCYRPMADWGGCLEVGASPVARNGRVTFGAFNNLSKCSPSCIDSWSVILHRVPNSTLVSRAKPFGLEAEREQFVRRFVERGIAAERIKPLPYLPDPERHLEIYHDVDIHLDSFPYTGGTTTCDALWMGVPVVTLSGDRPSARLGATVLTRVGMSDLIAESVEEYVRVAVALALDAPRLADLRAGLRARFMSSPTYDGEAFALGFEEACRRMWRSWCS